MECSVINETSISYTFKGKDHGGRKSRKTRRARYWDDSSETVSLTLQDHFPHELTAAVVVYRRSAQDQASKLYNMEGQEPMVFYPSLSSYGQVLASRGRRVSLI